MSSSADPQKWACDTSVAIASLDPSNPLHLKCRRAVRTHRPALAGHAAFECYSVLTHMPPPFRVAPAQAAKLLADAFAQTCWLDPADAAELLVRLSDLGISGGATYDALVGEAARSNDCRLLTADRRAEHTYRALGADYLFVQ